MPDGALTRPAIRRVGHRAEPYAGTCVLVHGTLDSSSSFRRVAEYLPHWTLVSYDRRGWGMSRCTNRTMTLADHVGDLAEILSRAGEPVVVAGHSYGGLAALSAAAGRAEAIRAVVAFEPSVRWLPWWPSEAPWEKIVRDAADDPAAAARLMIDEVTGMRLAGRRPPAELLADGRALLAEMLDDTLNTPLFEPMELEVPVIVAAGERSVDHHILVSKNLADLIPRGRYVELAGTGHTAHVAQPEMFAGLVSAAAALADPP